MNVAHIQAGFAYLVLAFATLLLKCLPQQAQISIPVKIVFMRFSGNFILAFLRSASACARRAADLEAKARRHENTRPPLQGNRAL